MLSILINAYACSPDMGSEPGMAWNWCVNLAKHCELHIITEGEFRDKIEAALPALPQEKNMHFYYNPVSDEIRKMCWNQGDWRFYFYYKQWQKKTLQIAQEIIKKRHIDLIHQLNMIGFREPGYLWSINEKPFSKTQRYSLLLSYLINDTHFSDDENEDDHFKQLLVLWAMDRLANFSDDQNYITSMTEPHQDMEDELEDLEDQVMELPKEESYQDKYNIYRTWYEDENNYAYRYDWKYLNALSAGDKELLKNSKYGDKMLSYLDTWEEYVAWYLDGQNVELDSITQDDISYYVTNDYVETKLITPKSTGKVYSDKFTSYTVEVSSPMTVLDINGNEKKEFKAGEGFKVRIPLSEIKDKTINYSIKVKGDFDFEELLLHYMLPPSRYEMPSDSQVYLYQLLRTSAVNRNCSTTKTLKDDIELNFTQKVGDLNIKVIDTSTGNNLSKATVQIEDEKGNIVYRYETTEKDFNVTLPTGNYLVKQTVTPLNYEAITVQMRVSVEENGESNVVLENAPLVNVPDTNMTSYMPLIGFITLIFGILILGIIIRTKKYEQDF